MAKIDTLRDEPLPKLVEALRPYKPRVFINFASDRYRDSVDKVRQDMEEKGMTVYTADDVAVEYSSYDGDKIESKLRGFDFVVDMMDGERDGYENFTQSVRRAAKSIQDEKPDEVYFRIQMAPSKDQARQMASRKVRTFSWTEDRDKRDVVLVMIAEMEKKGPRVSPWEAEFGERKFLLQKSSAVFAIEEFFPPEDRHEARELLREYSHIVLVNNQNSASVGLEFGMASEAFGVKNEGAAGIQMTCGGCGDVRGAIPIASTSMEKPNGMLVFESCTCENCGRFYNAKFDPSNTLQSVLEKRGKS